MRARSRVTRFALGSVLCVGATTACDSVLGIEDLEARAGDAGDASVVANDALPSRDDARSDGAAGLTFCEQPAQMAHTFCADFDRDFLGGWTTFSDPSDAGRLSQGTTAASGTSSLRAVVEVPFTAALDGNYATVARKFPGPVPARIVLRLKVYIVKLEAESPSGRISLAEIELKPFHSISLEVAPTAPSLALYEYYLGEGGQKEGVHPLVATGLPIGKWIPITVDIDVVNKRIGEVAIDGTAYAPGKPLFNDAVEADKAQVKVGLVTNDARGEAYFDDVTVDLVK